MLGATRYPAGPFQSITLEAIREQLSSAGRHSRVLFGRGQRTEEEYRSNMAGVGVKRAPKTGHGNE